MELTNFAFMNKKLFVIIFCSFPFVIAAQSNFAPLNEDYYHMIDRYEVKTGRIMPQIFTAIKPYKRSAIAAYVDSLSSNGHFYFPG